MDIVINPATAIAGAQFSLGYNPAYLTVDNVAEGNLFTQNDNSTYFYEGTTDNVDGALQNVADVALGGGSSVSTMGTMAVITMIAGTNNGDVFIKSFQRNHWEHSCPGSSDINNQSDSHYKSLDCCLPYRHGNISGCAKHLY